MVRHAKRRPDPVPGANLELGFLGSVLEVELPLTIDTQQLTGTPPFDETYNPELHVCLAIRQSHAFRFAELFSWYADFGVIAPIDATTSSPFRSVIIQSMVDMGVFSSLRTDSCFCVIAYRY